MQSKIDELIEMAEDMGSECPSTPSYGRKLVELRTALEAALSVNWCISNVDTLDHLK